MIEALVERTDGYKPRATTAPKQRADALVQKMRGDANPVGVGDEKTGVPGTYRPVGPTCPDSCPQAEACYATSGNVAIHQANSSADIERSVRAAAIAIVAAYRSGLPAARLHVSGDFGRTDDEVDAYCRALLKMLAAFRRKLDVPQGRIVAWSYTHHPRVVSRWLGLLKAAGVHVRRSDHVGPNGAIVLPFDRVVQARRDTGMRIAKCPAQISDVDCAACTLCWTRPDVVIAFDPHGAKKRRAHSAV